MYVKDGNLSSVWDEVNHLRSLTSNNQCRCHRKDENQSIEQQYIWFNHIDYHGYLIHWIECTETTRALSQQSDPIQTSFVHLTNLEIDYTNAPSISQTGRLRWKIENEGFNTQKNQGYEMQHQYSRMNWLASKIQRFEMLSSESLIFYDLMTASPKIAYNSLFI